MTRRYEPEAEAACDQRDYAEAGRYYTLAGYQKLADGDYPDPELITSGTAIGDAMYLLENAAFAFRLAGLDCRSDNRIEQALLVVEDFETSMFHDDALRGVAREFVGDFECIRGDIDAAMDAYETARDYYESISQWAWMTEPIFEEPYHFFLKVTEAAGTAPDEDELLSTYRSFDDRIDEKRDRLPDAVATVLDDGDYQPGAL
jgi:hypothetical protein